MTLPSRIVNYWPNTANRLKKNSRNTVETGNERRWRSLSPAMATRCANRPRSHYPENGPLARKKSTVKPPRWVLRSKNSLGYPVGNQQSPHLSYQLPGPSWKSFILWTSTSQAWKSYTTTLSMDCYTQKSHPPKH